MRSPGFFANVTGASQSHDVQLPRTSHEVHYLRTSQTLTPEALAFLSRTLGLSRDDAYRTPGAFSQLGRGLAVLDSAECSHGNPAPPTSNPLDARAADPGLRVPHRFSQRRGAPMRRAGRHPRLLDALPPAPRRARAPALALTS
jgi:hypothetical protein